MPTRTPPSDDQRREMIEHLEYEVAMLRGGLLEFVAKNAATPNVMALDRTHVTRIRRTAYFEVVLLHARLLDEFLTKKPTRDDDLWAGDFFTPGAWAPADGPLDRVASISGTGLTVRQTIHKQLAHISTARLSQSKFYIQPCVNAVVVGMSAFANDRGNRNYADLNRMREMTDPLWQPSDR
ncbi:hypothetical protein P3H80_12260 [Mycolicibacterium septicum]|uniref:hypothetical protein n=1 Tax=Mycolicibacterium septicum TaxID=98668 RepID=UPI0023E32F1C|nr:hypothetical protein [Mycolicibacterium septicum]MDF3338201.1 hypothetical protein [Mycolicibacterium septicum]